MTQEPRPPKSLAGRVPQGVRWKVAILVGLLVAWAYVFLVGDGGWLDLRSERERLATMQFEVDRLQTQNDSLRQVLVRMANDPSFLEKVAREKFGMIKPGEHLYLIKKPGTVADAKSD